MMTSRRVPTNSGGDNNDMFSTLHAPKLTVTQPSSSSSSSSSPNNIRKNLKGICMLITFCALFYVVNTTEMASIQRKIPGIDVETDSTTSSSASMDYNNNVEDEPNWKEIQKLRSKPTKSFLLPTESGEFNPKIVWLMSFPNSGTSYTMTLVQRSSNKSTATNYGDEVTEPDQLNSLSIYPRYVDGPFWHGLNSTSASPRELPTKYVLTKTHCGSRCLNCGPSKYIETPEEFLTNCASGSGRRGSNRRNWKVSYPPNRIYKAIHLIRNPFHNIIARFHLDHRHYNVKNKNDWVELHPNNKTGLLSWCNDLDTKYSSEDKKYFTKNKHNNKEDTDDFYKSIIKDVPCHGEFYKYTQWHNLVYESLKLIDDHNVPILTIHYEDYLTKFNSTVQDILNFLELEHVGIFREFTSRSDYDDYFTSKQQKQIRKLIENVASDTTWNLLKHYF